MTTQQKGLMLAGLTAVISGTANFANGLVVKGMDPLVHNVVKNGLVGIVVVSLLLLGSKWSQVKKLSQKQFLQLSLIALIGGSIPFVLFFTGVKAIGGVPGSLIHKTLIFWVALLAIPLLKEKMSWKLIAAILLLYGSNFVSGFKGFGELTLAHGMVLLATMMWGVENIIAKIVLKKVDADIVVAARMGGGALILTGILFATGKAPLVAALSGTQWLMLFGVAVLLLGYVMGWYRALKLLPATQVASVLVGATIVTTTLDAILVKHTYSLAQLGQAGLIVAGVTLVAMTALEARKLTAGKTGTLKA